MARKTRSSSTNSAVSWRSAQVAPATLLWGSEEYFISRAKTRIRAQFMKHYPDADRVEISAKDYRRGELAAAASPSLFSTSKIIEVDQLSSMSEDFLHDVMDYLQRPETHIAMVLSHNASNSRGKKLVDFFRASESFPLVECKPLKTDREKLEFVSQEFKDHRKTIEAKAVQLLVAATGADTAELASACSQLMSDAPDVVTEELVHKYYGGRTEVTAFKVSDAVVSGNSRLALRLLRHALATGVDPIPLVGALAARMRHIARVYGSRGNAAALAAELKMAPWQVEQAQRDSRRFSEQDLAEIFRVLAEVDAQLKGESTDPLFALEKAILTMSRS
ncbi:DNA polymerase III subunit delta [Rothia sp. P6271]|uniref:DNA polymerase III subunit delta n=1 Tax=unclassified Rothia (in: high G+C Gram-positive bacteria) TaxID=2689056 RepID=UPI003AC81527